MSATALKEDKPFGYGAGSFEPGEKNENDVEGLGSATRKYSRIGPAVGVPADSDSDKVDIGRQIEMEADAAIKYRTCSWQKVGFLAVFDAQGPVPKLYNTANMGGHNSH